MKKFPIRLTLGLLSIFHAAPLFAVCDYYKDFSTDDTVSKLLQLCGEPVVRSKYWDDTFNDVIYVYMYNETDELRGTSCTWLFYIDKKGLIFKIEQKD